MSEIEPIYQPHEKPIVVKIPFEPDEAVENVATVSSERLLDLLTPDPEFSSIRRAEDAVREAAARVQDCAEISDTTVDGLIAGAREPASKPEAETLYLNRYRSPLVALRACALSQIPEHQEVKKAGETIEFLQREKKPFLELIELITTAESINRDTLMRAFGLMALKLSGGRPIELPRTAQDAIKESYSCFSSLLDFYNDNRLLVTLGQSRDVNESPGMLDLDSYRRSIVMDFFSIFASDDQTYDIAANQFGILPTSGAVGYKHPDPKSTQRAKKRIISGAAFERWQE